MDSVHWLELFVSLDIWWLDTETMLIPLKNKKTIDFLSLP